MPAQDTERYIDVSMDWKNRRYLLGLIRNTKTGNQRWVLRVRFAARPLPRLPGDSHYFDAHVHTIGEWNQEGGFNLLSPKRNFGGPIPMIIAWTSRSVRRCTWSSWWNAPTGITSRPPGASCSRSAGGTSRGAAVTTIASKGAASGQPR